METARARPGEILLIATGPLTNVALALREEPGLPELLGGFALMGGAFARGGNVTPAAEANIWVDPLAAAEVFTAFSGVEEARLPICVGLDVTERAVMRRPDLDAVCAPAPDSPLAQLIEGATSFYMDFYFSVVGEDGCRLHDPLAVAIAIDESLGAPGDHPRRGGDRGQLDDGRDGGGPRRRAREPVARRLGAGGERTGGPRGRGRGVHGAVRRTRPLAGGDAGVTGSVVVIGAINVDLVVSGAPLPAPGQTVTGGVFAQHHGGKGGNQAVAASRARGGQGVVIVGSVGNDVLGHDALEALRAEGVATSVAMRPGVPTGVALICVGPDGENQISVAPGANAELTAGDVTSAFAQVLEIGVVLASLEVSQAAVRAAAAWCSEHEVPFILNPAPVQPWAAELASQATYVTPNEHELEAMGSLPDAVVVVETQGPGRRGDPSRRRGAARGGAPGPGRRHDRGGRLLQRRVRSRPGRGVGCGGGRSAARLPRRPLFRSRRSAPAKGCRPARSSRRSSAAVMPTPGPSGYGASVTEDRRAARVNVVVLTKWVPEPEGTPTLGDDGLLVREGADGALDPGDEYGLEAALQLVEAAGDGEITLLTMGPEVAQAALQRGLAMGAHKGVRITDDSLRGADSLVTARVLAAAIKRQPFDLVVGGVESTDGYTGIVPAAIAELLGSRASRSPGSSISRTAPSRSNGRPLPATTSSWRRCRWSSR